MRTDCGKTVGAKVGGIFDFSKWTCAHAYFRCSLTITVFTTWTLDNGRQQQLTTPDFHGDSSILYFRITFLLAKYPANSSKRLSPPKTSDMLIISPSLSPPFWNADDTMHGWQQQCWRQQNGPQCFVAKHSNMPVSHFIIIICTYDNLLQRCTCFSSGARLGHI